MDNHERWEWKSSFWMDNYIMDIIFSWIFDIANDISWWYWCNFHWQFLGDFRDWPQSVSMANERRCLLYSMALEYSAFYLHPGRKWDSFLTNSLDESYSATVANSECGRIASLVLLNSEFFGVFFVWGSLQGLQNNIHWTSSFLKRREVSPSWGLPLAALGTRDYIPSPLLVDEWVDDLQIWVLLKNGHFDTPQFDASENGSENHFLKMTITNP